LRRGFYFRRIELVQVGLDYTLLIQILQFFIIVFLVNIFIVKPLYSTILKRNGRIASLLERAKAASDKVENKKNEYDALLAAVRHQISEYQNSLRANAVRKAADIVEKSKAAAATEIDKKIKNIQSEIVREREKLKGDLKGLSEQIILAVTKEA
jgi:F-type H+-transporting ATPase subunit b